VGTARDWLTGKAKGAAALFGRAFVWDYLDGAWRVAAERDLRPGITLYVDEAAGGYRPTTGFDPRIVDAVPPIPPLRADAQERADSAQDHEDLSIAAYQTVGFHGAAVGLAAAQIGAALGLPASVREALDLAGRWHDLGKVHPAFQGAITGAAELPRPARADLAKAPGPAWRQGRDPYRFTDADGREQRRPGFRHELASTLAMFAALAAHAPADNPARLGAWAALLGGEAPTEADPGPLERELLALSAEDFNLVAFLVCAHHGKLRARLHASPADQRAALRDGDLPVRGVYDGEPLPAATLQGRDGAPAELPSRALSLDPARLGLSPRTGASWAERVDALRDQHGPGALAFLEALLRAADVRASADASLRDPAFAAAAAPEHA
jgi:CRISPR-associated endonuclease/helicase Cas3